MIAYSQTGEEASHDGERSIFDNGTVNALYRYGRPADLTLSPLSSMSASRFKVSIS